MSSTLSIETRGRGLYEFTRDVAALVPSTGAGLCHLFIRHTSASLIITENAAPAVRVDLERFFGDLVPDGDPRYAHDDEGPDDMPAHVRSVLTQMSLSIPYRNGQLLLGTWQGAFLWEHRHAAHRRDVVVTFVAEAD